MGEYTEHWDLDNYSYSEVQLQYFDDVEVPALIIKDLIFDNPYNLAHIYVEHPVFLAPVAPPYYHALIDVVGEFEFLKLKYPHLKIVFCANDHFFELKKHRALNDAAYIDSILKLYESENRLVDLKNYRVHFKEVIHFASRSMWSQDRMVPLAIQEAAGDFNRESCVSRRVDLIDPIRKKLLPAMSHEPTPEKIYSARVDLSNPMSAVDDIRSYADEYKIIEHFKANGFEIINLNNVPLEKQIALFANAKEIAGIAGTNLVNAIFASPGTKLYQIHATNLWAYSLYDDYFNAASLNVMNIAKDYSKSMNLDGLTHVPVEVILNELNKV